MKSVKITVNKDELRAAVDVVKLLAMAAVLATVVVFVLENVSMQVIGWAFGVGFFAYMVYIMYAIRLSQLKYQSKLKETVATFKE